MPKLKARRPLKRHDTPIKDLIELMARLRAPDGCPWDREQDHLTLRHHAVEEVYELLDAIEAGDEHEMVEELGDLLLQVIFHCQLGRERGAFDFDQVCERIVNKLVHRHPHVFGDQTLHTADAVLAQWEVLKRNEKKGTKHERPSALDGIPKHLPALQRAEKLVKKARKAGLPVAGKGGSRSGKAQLAQQLFELAAYAQSKGWSAEELLRAETKRQEHAWRRIERKLAAGQKTAGQ
jgi:XTP/dITP diphosphohydrolase